MLTRRTLLTSAAIAASCAHADIAFGSAPRDVVVMAMQIDDIISLDPQECFEFSGDEVCNNLYQRLVRPAGSDPGTLVPDLAERWEISDDARTYTFHLRADAVFSSGAPVTAGDAAFSLCRAVILNKSPGFIISQFGLTSGNVERCVVDKDARTLVISLPEAQAPSFFLNCLTANVASIVEKSVALSNAQGDDLGNGWLKGDSAGSGPWVLREWRPSEAVILDANPHRPDATKVRRVVLRHVADPAAQMLMLSKGDADIARDLQSDQLRSIQGSPDYQLVSTVASNTMYLAMNQRSPQLVPVEVHQAIKWAIDYAGIRTSLVPTSWKVHQTIVPDGFPSSMADTPFRRDTGRARALLKAAGFANGFELTLDHYSASPYSEIAQAVQANLADIGIRVKLLPGEQRQVVSKTRARQHQLALLVWGSDYFDPNSNVQAFAENADNSDASANRSIAWRSSWVIPELTGRALAAARETDGLKRSAAYRDIIEEILQTGPFALLFQQVATATMRKGTYGLHLGPLPFLNSYEDLQKS
jgi:peptide/nickel transport system substrate-binding protein